MIGRRKPYTARGIRRLWCQTCRARKASHQWDICSLDHRFVPICTECDIALNATVLRFLKVPGAADLAARYARKVRAAAAEAGHA
jgi:hypothetical protein